MDGEIRLRIVDGPQAGREFVFDAHDTFVFGRAPDCHCSVPDDRYISARHFLVEVNPPDAVIRDLGSKNGTRVNGVLTGQRARGEAPDAAAARSQVVALIDGDRIKAGVTEFQVRVKRPTPAPEPARRAPAPPEHEPGLMTGVLAAVARNIGAGPLPAIPGFKVEKKLKEGGMGQVLLARRQEDGKAMVLKVIKPQAGSVTDRQKKLFQREMALSIELRVDGGHRNIAHFDKSGIADDIFYFAMEYYPDGSVWDLMQQGGGRLPPRQAVELAAQALEGLAFAHAKGVVHRDIKPENILLAKEDGGWVAKVADFGLAKNFIMAGMSGMTSTGSMGSGTPEYMPLEQLMQYRDSRPVSDIFSLGASLYNMLTGKYVYDMGADAVVAVMNGRVVPVRQRGVALPRALTEVVDKAVAVQAAERYQTADAFRAALLAAAPAP